MKTKNIIGIIIIILSVATLLYFGSGGKFSLIQDNMLVYDNFNTLDYNKWIVEQSFLQKNAFWLPANVCLDKPTSDATQIFIDEQGCPHWAYGAVTTQEVCSYRGDCNSACAEIGMSLVRTISKSGCNYDGCLCQRTVTSSYYERTTNSCTYNEACCKDSGTCITATVGSRCNNPASTNSYCWTYKTVSGVANYGGLTKPNPLLQVPQSATFNSVTNLSVLQKNYFGTSVTGQLFLNSAGQNCDYQNWYTKTKMYSTKNFTSEDIKIVLDFTYTEWSADYMNNVITNQPKIMFGEIDITPAPTTLSLSSGQRGYCGSFDMGYGGVYTQQLKGNLEIKRYDDLDLSKYVVVWNGQEIKSGVNKNPSPIIFYGNKLKVDAIKYQPYFSCEIDYNTEVVVRDKFTAGSTIDTTKLTYVPIKFCPQDLGVLIFSDKGLTDEKGSITTSLAQGKQLTVPAGQYWQIDYVAKYVTDMKEKCGVGYAYSTVSKSCISVASQEVPDSVLLECNNDKDCYIPVKCTDATATCEGATILSSGTCKYTSNVCDYNQIINAVLTDKTTVTADPKIITVSTGQNTITFSTSSTESHDIFGFPFTSSIPISLNSSTKCNVEWGKYLREDGCYQTKLYWGDYSYVMKDNDKVGDNFVNIEYQFTGNGVYYGSKGDKLLGTYREYNYEYRQETDWKNTWTLDFKKILSINAVSLKETYKLNDDAELVLSYTNNLKMPITGGYYFSIRKSLTDVTEESTIQGLTFDTGNNEIKIKLPTNTIGMHTVSITPFADIDANNKYTEQSAVFAYYVGEVKPDCRKLACSVGECSSDGSCVVKGDLYRCVADSDCSLIDSKATCNKQTGFCLVSNTPKCSTDAECSTIQDGATCNKQTGFCVMSLVAKQNIFQKFWAWITGLFN